MDTPNIMQVRNNNNNNSSNNNSAQQQSTTQNLNLHSSQHLQAITSNNALSNLSSPQHQQQQSGKSLGLAASSVAPALSAVAYSHLHNVMGGGMPIYDMGDYQHL
jgi:hypothetical protein